MNSITTDLVGTCAICKRRHDNIGWAASERHPVKWMCWDCLDDTHNGIRSKLPKVYHMPKRQLDDYERRALEDGGNAGGEYLDSIQKTDLASLDDHEWREFLRRVLVGYADGMREIVSKEIPY